LTVPGARSRDGERGPRSAARFVDLHVHTTASDGRLTPAEVVAVAAQRGLSAIAITDHDVLSGLDEAVAAAPNGLEVVGGIEMTCRWQGPRAVHVLGYFVDRANPQLLAALERAQRLMERHVDHVLEAIRAVGGVLQRTDLDRYRHRYAGGAALVLGMLERGVLRGAPAGTGMRLLRLAAAEPRAFTVGEAIELIHRAGGVASLAHPAKLKRGEPLLSRSDLEPLVAEGFDAIEAWQWIPGGWGSRHYLQQASELGVLVSGGSDDHGKRAPDGSMRLGTQPISAEVLEALRERARAPRPA
jgi:3',5'-nucleoside bisphosphate phosphatase